MHRRTAIVCIAYLIAVGCAQDQSVPRSNGDYVGRMNSVVVIALDKASDPLHRDLIRRGVVFVDLEELDAPCAGLRVPIPGSDKRIFLSFTKEWFDEKSDEAVADALINDLGRVLDDVESQTQSH